MTIDHSVENDQEVLLWFQNWIKENTGIFFGANKIDILHQRLKNICVKEGIKSIQEFKSLILDGKKTNILHHIIDVATTNHTHFYREVSSIEYLVNTIYNEFQNLSNIRIWSAASSSGEELYTIIIFLIETLGVQKVKSLFSFLGTDLSIKVVDQAEKGIYPDIRVEFVPEEIKKKWFNKSGIDMWRLDQTIINMCIFRRLNLLCNTWPFVNKFNVIFLRNVLYYFDVKTQQIIVDRLYQYTEEGGYLITSVTESFTQFETKWKKVESGIYRK